MSRVRTFAAVSIVCGVLGGCSTVVVPVEAPPVAQQAWQEEVAVLESRAEQAVAQGDYRQAILLYERIVAASPRNAQALFRMGTLRLRIDDQRLAQYDFERALQIDPGMSKAHANLAIVHLRQFRVSAARAIDSAEVSADNRATLRVLMRDVDHALYPAAALPPAAAQ